MPLIIPTGFAQVLIPIRHIGEQRAAAITFGVDATVAGDVDAAKVNDIQLAFTDNFPLDSDVSIGPSLARVGTGGGEALTVEGSLVEQGTASGSTIPSNCAVLMRKVTARGGRRGKGRFFVPWLLGEGDVDEVGTVSSVVRESISSAGAAMLADLLLAECPMVLLHSSGGDTPPGDPTGVTNLVCDSRIGTQRRRLRR